jgi:hypothetical protein
MATLMQFRWKLLMFLQGQYLSEFLEPAWPLFFFLSFHRNLLLYLSSPSVSHCPSCRTPSYPPLPSHNSAISCTRPLTLKHNC